MSTDPSHPQSAGRPQYHHGLVDTAPASSTGPAAASWGELARNHQRRSRSATGPAGMILGGYRESPGPQRVLFGMSSSAAVTITASRVLNYVRERRRAMPKVRSFGRLLRLASANNSLRVHHFLPGMAIGFTTGSAALLARGGTLEQWLSLPFGAGLALTTDELPLLAGGNNPYWGRERFALLQGSGAALVSLALTVLFLRRGQVITGSATTAQHPRRRGRGDSV